VVQQNPQYLTTGIAQVYNTKLLNVLLKLISISDNYENTACTIYDMLTHESDIARGL